MRTRLSLSLSFTTIVLALASDASAQLRHWGRPADRDVASVHVAVQSIAPFEDYIAALQPTFGMTPGDAMRLSIPQTRLEGTETLNAYVAKIEAALRGGGVAAPTDEKPLTPAFPDAASRTITPTLPEGKPELDAIVLHNAATALLQYVAHLNTYVRDAAVTTRTRPYIIRMQVSVLPTTATRGYDTYSTISFFTEPGNGNLAASRFARDTETRIGQMALALEVAKKELEAAALLAQEADKAFTNGPSETTAKARGEALNRQRRAQELVNKITSRHTLDTEDLKRIAEAKEICCTTSPLRVIPLLVTDNFESSLHLDTFEQIRNIAVAAASSGVRGRIAAGFRRQLDDAAKTLTRNLNGLMTATQVSENTIQVRLGAMYGNRTDAMLSRTYGVTLLVLFPTAEQLFRSAPEDSVVSEVLPCSFATFTSDTFFRDGRRGKIVRRTSDDDLVRALRQAAPELSWDDSESALRAIQTQNYRTFQSIVRTSGSAIDLWSRLVAVASVASASRGSFQAPFRETRFFTSESYGSVIDDGKKSQLTLNGGINLLPDRIAATLQVHLKDAGGAKRMPLFVNATAVDVTTDGRMATLTFPSIHALVKKDSVDRVYAVVRYQKGVRHWQTAREELEQEWFPGMDRETPSVFDDKPPFWFPASDRVTAEPIAYVGPLEEPKKEDGKKTAAFTMKTTSSFLYARRNSGVLGITLKHDVDTATFRMFFGVEKGGRIVSVDPAVDATRGDRNTAADGEYRLTLDNLTVGSTVTLKSWRIDEADGKTPIPGESITIEVRE